MSNTCILQTHSEVNEDLYRLTLPNHAEYASCHGYDMVQMHMSYEEAKQRCVQIVIDLLHIYDTVFTMGSDVIFTDMKRPLESFWRGDEQIVAPLEGIRSSIVNADTILWQRPIKHDRPDAILDLELRGFRWKDHPWGLQAELNMIYEYGSSDAIRWAAVREMQSAPFHNHVRAMWCPGDFAIHFFCGDNADKFRRCEHFLKTGEVLWWQVN